jgi:hypothetical protein
VSFNTTFELEGPDRDVIARQILRGKKRVKRNKVDLAAAIETTTIKDTLKGSSTIEVVMNDPEFELLESGFFDPNDNGKLDSVEINYPDDSRFWWSLTQVAVTAGEKLTLTFMERAAADLLKLKGPVKAKSRAKTTRAEFLNWLTGHVKDHGGLDFHSRELHKKQRIGREKHKRTGEERERNKDGGIHRKENLTIKGSKATAAQLDQVARALDVAADLDAPRLAVIAEMCAGIGESSFIVQMNQAGSQYGGVFQGNVGGGVFNINDTEGMARCFLLGGKGFQAGGAIHLVRSGVKDPGDIATRVEASGMPGSFYGQYRNEAEKLIEAYGGGDFSTVSRYKQYNFDVGSPDNPHETFWDAANRLAEEVNWAFFVDGNDVYYDSEMTLIKQKPIAIIDRDEASVVDWDYDWDTRHIATEMTLVLICRPFAFRSGQVFKLRGFGPASVGSTAKLPGRWLISEAERNEDGLATTFTLIQPTKPNPEPAPEIVSSQTSDTGGPIKGSPRHIINEIVLPMAREAGIHRTVGENDAANARHGPTTSGGTSDHQGPPEIRWAADMSNGTSPTPQMDDLAKALWQRFDLPPLDLKATGAGGSSQSSSATHDGYRFQLIYRSYMGGNHDNHVHFGVEEV